MKSVNSFAHRMRAQIHMPGRPHSKETGQGGSQPSPSSAASGEIEPRRSLRSARVGGDGETSTRRSAPPPRASGASINSTPTPSFRSNDVPGQTGEISEPDLDKLIKELNAQINGIERSGPSQPPAQTTLQPAPTSELAEMRRLADGLRHQTHDTTTSEFAQVRKLVDGLRHQTHRTKTQVRADYFRSMGDLISELAQAKTIQWDDRSQELLELLRRHSGELAHSAESTPAADEDSRAHLNQYMSDTTNLDEKARNALQQLLHAHLPTLLEHVEDPDNLKHLANDLVIEIDGHQGLRAQLREQGASLALLQAVDEEVASIRKNIALAGSEFKLQRELLAKVGGALLELGEAKIKGLEGGLNHILRQILPRKVAKKFGIDTRPRADQVRDQIAEGAGPYYKVNVSRENKDKLDMSLNSSSIGQITTGDLEEHLSSMAQRKKETPKLIHRAVLAAANKHPKLTTKADKNGQTQVLLAEPAHQHLDGLRHGALSETSATHHPLHGLRTVLAHQVQELEHLVQHGSDRHQDALTQATGALRAVTRLIDMPPRDRMIDAAKKAMAAAQFGVLKLSLVQSFSGRVAERVALAGENRWQINPELTHAKASLLADTMEKMLGSANKEEMLTHLAEAEHKHDEILREKNFAGGGQTADLLKDMRSALERFFLAGRLSLTGLGGETRC